MPPSDVSSTDASADTSDSMQAQPAANPPTDSVVPNTSDKPPTESQNPAMKSEPCFDVSQNETFFHFLWKN